MRTIATDDRVAWCVSQSVCHAAALCKTAKGIEVQFGVETLGDSRQNVKDGVTTLYDGDENGEDIDINAYTMQYIHTAFQLIRQMASRWMPPPLNYFGDLL